MKNIILLTSIVLIPFITLASNLEEINKLMNRIKSNSKAYRIICYGDRNTIGNTFISTSRLDIDNKEEYCVFLKEEIENDIDKVLKMRGKK
jgi:hypothetical protein